MDNDQYVFALTICYQNKKQKEFKIAHTGTKEECDYLIKLHSRELYMPIKSCLAEVFLKSQLNNKMKGKT